MRDDFWHIMLYVTNSYLAQWSYQVNYFFFLICVKRNDVICKMIKEGDTLQKASLHSYFRNWMSGTLLQQSLAQSSKTYRFFQNVLRLSEFYSLMRFSSLLTSPFLEILHRGVWRDYSSCRWSLGLFLVDDAFVMTKCLTNFIA